MRSDRIRKSLIVLVGARGFEPPTPASRTRCATGLRYAPMYEKPSRLGHRSLSDISGSTAIALDLASFSDHFR